MEKDMESLNLIKNAQTDSPSFFIHSRRSVLAKRMILYLIVSTALLLILLLLLTVHVFRNHSASHDSSVRAVCNVTLYPNLCVSGLSPLVSASNRDPEAILKLSMGVSSEGIENVSSSLKSFKIGDSSGSLSECAELMEDARSRVKDSLKEMEVGAGEKVLDSKKIGDIRTWLSAALTNQETCLEGLEEIADTAVDDAVRSIKERIEVCKKMLSNSLAIVSHMDQLLAKFNIKMY